MAKLLAVNVGLPKDVPWQGRTVHTGVWKHPVEGPRMVRRLNIDGDGQGDRAGHGGEQRAVFVYQIDSYHHWAEHFGRDDFVYGQFGENFTVEGLPDDEVCIGDRYRIGTAEFEVTQPRVTCYRVGLRMDEPQMAALLVSHRRPGFYYRVITEGEVTAGDEIVKIADGPESITVTELDAMLYLPEHPREKLADALRVPALSPGWRTSLQTLLDQGETGGAGGNPALSGAAGGRPPGWSGFRPLRVARIHDESSRIFSLTLTSEDTDKLAAPLPGQFLTVKMHPAAEAPPLIRSYSLSGAPTGGEYRITVKQEPHGAGSGYLRDRVSVGDTLEVAAPRGTFTLASAESPVLLVSAGVGATPNLAMLHALAEERSEREVWWLYGARNGLEHPFAEEARSLLARLPNSHGRVYYSAPRDEDRAGVDYDEAGHLSTKSYGSLGVPKTAEAYLCGPPAFLTDLSAALADYGLAPDRIRSEVFGSQSAINPGVIDNKPAEPPHPPPGKPGTGPSVSFARSGLNVNWDPEKYTSLLELAEACAVPTQWSCRTGICHTCEIGLLSGTLAYSPEPVDPPAEGNALTCCSTPEEDIVLDM
ncbi:sulfurase [Streptomyces sp. 150FB]|uniref:MOSC and FAD-binding oxidoreductase domain-containing protein n=1 Tax=Streptomyces sp. 150FB TaxID=1576605 RepID=UPI000588FDDD|nr:MOSC and FAD-binding oxidoreductase domain-containing protein [Streptomyces sp. 150FB]KIF76846.1 sulfurase [Streptomyces sp. 150FB]